MRLEHLTQERFEDVVSSMRMEELVPRINHLLPSAEPVLKSERAIPFMTVFSIRWGEFQRMDGDILWGKYIDGVIKETLLKVKNTARERKTRVKFFRFRHPQTSLNVRSLVFDADGVFAVLTVRHCVHPTHKDRGTEVAEFTFRVEIGEFDK